MARTPIHPSEILADELEELGVSPTELSRQIRVPANRIIWMNLQALYDVRIAEEEAGTEIRTLPTKPEKSPTGQPHPA